MLWWPIKIYNNNKNGNVIVSRQGKTKETFSIDFNIPLAVCATCLWRRPNLSFESSCQSSPAQLFGDIKSRLADLYNPLTGKDSSHVWAMQHSDAPACVFLYREP